MKEPVELSKLHVSLHSSQNSGIWGNWPLTFLFIWRSSMHEWFDLNHQDAIEINTGLRYLLSGFVSDTSSLNSRTIELKFDWCCIWCLSFLILSK